MCYFAWLAQRVFGKAPLDWTTNHDLSFGAPFREALLVTALGQSSSLNSRHPIKTQREIQRRIFYGQLRLNRHRIWEIYHIFWELYGNLKITRHFHIFHYISFPVNLLDSARCEMITLQLEVPTGPTGSDCWGRSS